jgi:pyridoxine 5-phosphate synthase
LSKIRLGVNIDHVATLRQLRAGTVNYPNLIEARNLVVRGGAEQITVHLRGDRRHIQEHDLFDLVRERGPILLNLEMAATTEMTAIAGRAKPDIVCLVPEKREELTTEGGIDVLKNRVPIEGCIHQLKKNKIKISLFIEPNHDQITASHAVGADAIELHTGKYSLAKGPEQKKILEQLWSSAELAHRLGLKVHAGHGLDYSNVIPLKTMPYLEELNIGHSIICRAISVGILEAVREMKALIN